MKMTDMVSWIPPKAIIIRFSQVTEGPAYCIRIDEIAAALKKMKRQSPRLVRANSRNDTNHWG